MENVYCSMSSCTLPKEEGGLTWKQQDSIQKYGVKHLNATQIAQQVLFFSSDSYLPDVRIVCPLIHLTLYKIL